MNEKVLVLLDSDVLIHLFKASKLSLLGTLFPGRLRILDIVLNELRNNRTAVSFIDSLFVFGGFEEIRFPMSDPKLLSEFANLTGPLGKGTGESATLIFCKYNHHIIASSNTVDIKPYCDLNQMSYLTTLDIFCIAVHRNEMTEVEADAAIQEIKRNNSYLPTNNLSDYRNSHFKAEKLLF